MSWWDRVDDEDAQLVLGRLEVLSEGPAAMASIQELSEETGLPDARVEEILRNYPEIAGELELFDVRGRPFRYLKPYPATLPGRWLRLRRYAGG